MSASGGPKNGISMASVESVPIRNRYGMPNDDADHRDQHGLDDGQDDLGPQEATEGAGHAALQEGELVGVPARDRAVDLRPDPLAVHEHVEGQDQDQDQRSECCQRRAGDHLRLVEDGAGQLADLRSRRVEQLDQVDLGRIQPERRLVPGQRLLDLTGRYAGTPG